MSKQESSTEDIYIERILKRIQNYMIQNEISQSKLANYCGINQSSISKLLKGTSAMSLSTLLKICLFLKLEPSDLLSSRNTFLDNINTIRYRANNGYNGINDHSLVYDSGASPFNGLLGDYFFYCKPTISTETGFLKGVFSLNHSNAPGNYCKAKLELYTGQINIYGDRISKEYIGEMIISLPMSSCYVILFSEKYAEYCFLNFHHMYLNNQDLECSFVFCLISSAGSNRRPTVEKAIISRTELSDENLEELSGQMNMNTATISILEQNYNSIKHALSPQALELLDNLFNKDTLCSIDESQIRGSNLSSTDKISTINLLRKHSTSSKYSKISTKSDEILYAYIEQKKQQDILEKQNRNQ